MKIEEKIEQYLINENKQNIKKVIQYLKRIGKLILGMKISPEEVIGIVPSSLGGHFISDEAISYIRRIKKAVNDRELEKIVKDINKDIEKGMFSNKEIDDLRKLFKNMSKELEKRKDEPK